jgi:hypothetical protein
MPAVSNIEAKVEEAFRYFLSNHADLSGLGLNFFTGVEDEDQALPCVVAHAMSATEEPQGFGNYFVDVAVWIKTKLHQADPSNPNEDRKAAHNTNVAAVRDVLSTDDLASQLSATQADFYVFDPVVGGATQHGVDGTTAKTLKQFKVYCCPTDIT